ncbi:E3 ubiquitin ligase [Emiliania huxleyi CCMP1516]|uniref:RCC1-like domain-containing protein n=2 Tax=Emiliania huxleyi TaxID=2903 RepID=A0A0D3JEU2_EMIH1|nr:E3 ubiquitin ligase [Emiliania huxleyi CCMP1516]EOD22027.1 E3 ubiquitin ligase [Emiliania huxleyi CCMP1516]|eukprot:XP_005774456.1 E3 ubiquitin ligase [Emiliania huxleyi CCMP1516]
MRWLCYSALLCESNRPARAAAGERHSVFIDGEGRLSSCGSVATEGEEEEEEEEEEALPGPLGHGEGVPRLNTPTRLPSTLDDVRAVSVAAGGDHSLALTADSAVWSWGFGWNGRLGHGDEQDHSQPKKIEALAGRRVVAVSAGDFHSLALTVDGAVWSWGRGVYGQLGHGDQQNQLLPKKVEAFAGQRVVAVSAGGDHSLALTADGSVWSWGSGDYGKLGHGDQQRQLLPKKHGTVLTFGNGDDGQLGHGNTNNLWLPTPIPALVARAISAGEHHSLALSRDGSVFAFGNNANGQLGLGDREDRLTPTRIPGLPAVKAVSAGADHSLVVTCGGAVYSFGDGDMGQLGHGLAEVFLLQPTEVEALRGVGACMVVAGYFHSLIGASDGRAFGFGCGEDERLGLGLTADQTSPLEYPHLKVAVSPILNLDETAFMAEGGGPPHERKECLD